VTLAIVQRRCAAVVARVHVRATRQQLAHDGRVAALLAGDDQRRTAVVDASVYGSAARQQLAHNLELAFLARKVERRAAKAGLGLDVRARVEQEAHHVQVAVAKVQRRVAVLGLRLELGAAAHELAHDREVAVRARKVQRRPAKLVLRVHVALPREQLALARQVALPARPHEACHLELAVPRVLERPAQLHVVQPEVAAQAKGERRVPRVARERDVLQHVVEAHAAPLEREKVLGARVALLQHGVRGFALAEPRAQRRVALVARRELRVARGEQRKQFLARGPGAGSAARGGGEAGARARQRGGGRGRAAAAARGRGRGGG